MRTLRAATLAVVLVLATAFLGACGDDSDLADVADLADLEDAGSTTTTAVPATTAAPSTTTVPATTAAPSTTTVPAPTTIPTTTAGVEACSAANLDAPPTPAVLGEAAAATYRAIVDAAVACDFDALAVAAGDAITLSFGGHDDVAEFLATAEYEYGDELLRILVQLLTMEPGYRIDFATWVWPTFWGDDSATPTAEQKAAIEAIYGVPFDEILVEGWYLDHRVGIDADGEWLYFVAGD